jgi:hypothetical protein
VAKEIEGKIYDALGLGEQDLVQPIEHEDGAEIPEVPEIAAV